MKYYKLSVILLTIIFAASCSSNKTSKIETSSSDQAQESMQKKSLDSGIFTIYFDTNSAQLTESTSDYLKNSIIPMINSASNDKKIAVRIEGHCDERGSAAYNKALGAKRATAVKDFIKKQVSKKVIISTVSYGKSRPVAIGHDEESWAKNRRAVVISIK